MSLVSVPVTSLWLDDLRHHRYGRELAALPINGSRKNMRVVIGLIESIIRKVDYNFMCMCLSIQ